MRRCSVALLALVLVGVYGRVPSDIDGRGEGRQVRSRPERPRPERPARTRPERPQRERPQRERPQRERPERTRPERPARTRPERPQRERPQRERPERTRPETRPERPQRERPERRERPQRERPQRERPERTRPETRPQRTRPETRPERRPRRTRPERCAREVQRAIWMCKRWIHATCPGITSKDQMAECFIENRSNAPARCERAAVAAFKCEHEKESEKKCLGDFGQEAKRACWPDIQKFCMRQLPHGFRPTFECMMRHGRQLSAVCRAESRNLVTCVQCKNAERNVFDVCMETFVKVCKGTKKGEEEKCFRENIDEFTPQCKRAAFHMKDTCSRQEKREHEKNQEIERSHRREHQNAMRREGDVMRKEEELSKRMPSMFFLL